MYQMIRALTQGPIENKAARTFNELLINRLSKLLAPKSNPEYLAVAYVATPHALAKLKNHYLAIPDEQFQKAHSAQTKTIIIYKKIYDGPPSRRIAPLCYRVEDKREET